MAELKTRKNNASVSVFLDSVSDEQKRMDCKLLLKIFKDATGEKPSMWGSSIIGFGSYHYESSRSSQKGDWFLTGFSPRKQNIAVYLMSGFSGFKDFLKKLGKHKVSGGSCLYINRLLDIDTTVLKKLIAASVKEMKKKYPAK